MIQKKLGLTAIAVFLTIAGAAAVLQRAAAQDKLEYNQIYDCGEGKSKFKVLSCKGAGKFDRCDIFYINEYSPGGGFKDSISRSQIDDMLNQGCKIKGRAARNETVEAEQSEEETDVSNNEKTPAKGKTDDAAVCSASSDDSEGKTANEKSFRGVIRRLWEKEAAEGSDGAVTVTFQKMIVGAPRRWRPTFDDAYAQADPRKPIYPVRATFTTCTDYKTAVSKRKMERIYDCYVHKTGGWQCTQTGASGPLAMKDEKEYIQKKRQ